MLDATCPALLAFPQLTFMVTQVAQTRASAALPRGHKYAWLTKIPADFRDYPEHCCGANPRASDKKKGLAAARRELAALTPEAAELLAAAYSG